jgi:hypothetical protein
VRLVRGEAAVAPAGHGATATVAVPAATVAVPVATVVVGVVVAVAAMLLAVTGCAPAPAPPAPGRPSGSACADVRSLTTLVVTRSLGAAAAQHASFAFPAIVTVEGAAVRRVARAFCAPDPSLPVSSPGGCAMPAPDGHGCDAVPASPPQFSFPCLEFVFVTYSLTFWAGGRQFRSITVGPGDCQQAQAWQALAAAMNLPHPGVAALNGGVSP